MDFEVAVFGRQHCKHVSVPYGLTIRLPFAPFPGLVLEFTSPNEADEDPLSLMVEKVYWGMRDSIFHCSVEESVGNDAHSTMESLVDYIEFISRCGFDVDTTWLKEEYVATNAASHP